MDRRSFFADVVEDVEVILAGMVPGVIAAHAVNHKFAEVLGVVLP